MTMLGFLTPIVLGVLKNVKRTKGLDSAGLSNLLSSQRTNFAAAMSEGTPGRIGTTGETTSYAREPLREAAYRASEPQHPRAAETYRRSEGAEKSSRSWVLPLAILCGLLGLLWYWGSHPSVHAARETGGATERAATPENEYRRGPTVSLDTLKTKYQSVINLAQAQGVQISRLDQQGGKLFIKGTAPSLEAANKVWDEIKRVNPTMDDIVADFPVK